MVESGGYASIADAGKPNAGRIYDFLLGGDHNFEVDRVAAQQILSLMPFFPKLFKLVRWFLGESVRRLAADGFTQFIDFASGLPTVDHIHQVAPPGTKVIYSDIDPITVAYGQEIIKDNPNVRYAVCPAEKPEDLLGSPVIGELFGNDRKVAIGLNGIVYFLPDEAVSRAVKVLYDWAGAGSRLFLCDLGFHVVEAAFSKEGREMAAVYQKMSQPVFPRSQRTLEKLVKPWKATPPGYKRLEDWVGVKGGGAEESMPQGFAMFGAILEK